MYDLEIIKSFYEALPERIRKIRKRAGRPLTLTEKILFNHLYDDGTDGDLMRNGQYADFRPDRLAMQDATAQMALLQFILAGSERSAIPASVHCDHLIVAEKGGEEDLKKAVETGKEVYEFLESVCRKYGISFWKPGSGIIHQIVLENYAFPGGMITGTDSHTPNAGGLGMMGVGVGGADAVDAMTGMPWELKMPEIIGVRLTGRLSGWCSPKDVILKLAGILTVKGATGSVIEYFGDGASSISCTGKATICNMGAETGATSSVFPFDASMVHYLNYTGRNQVAELALKNRMHLQADPEVYAAPEKYYDRVIEINLSELDPHLNGPFTPDLATTVQEMKKKAEEHNWPPDVEAVLIGSCTNSSFEDLSKAASVVKDALEKKLKPVARIYVSPGSEFVRALAAREGILDLFRRAGAEIFANACGPCIGQWKRQTDDNERVNTIVHTFNRNFSKRTDGNPNTHVFVASPEIAAAIAFSGKLSFDPSRDKLLNEEGKLVMLDEPLAKELPENARGLMSETGAVNNFQDEDTEIIIPPNSQRLQLLKPFEPWNGKDFQGLYLLIKVKGKCTTDHISMAGPWLKYRGHLENISENYMTGAVNAFNNLTNSVLNQLTGEYSPVPAAAKAYRDTGTGSVVIAGENFGEGSSREHAAMEARFLGVKAIIAKLFARIHETNLKKQGVLALTFMNPDDYDRVREDDRVDITGITKIAPGSTLKLVLRHSDGTKEEIPLLHSYSEKQIEWFREGSALNVIRKAYKE
ncbi:MAG: aconitate hydratase [Bacteroidales bacterium]